MRDDWEHISKPLNRALRRMVETMEREDAEKERPARRRRKNPRTEIRNGDGRR